MNNEKLNNLNKWIQLKNIADDFYLKNANGDYIVSRTDTIRLATEVCGEDAELLNKFINSLNRPDNVKEKLEQIERDFYEYIITWSDTVRLATEVCGEDNDRLYNFVNALKRPLSVNLEEQ